MPDSTHNRRDKTVREPSRSAQEEKLVRKDVMLPKALVAELDWAIEQRVKVDGKVHVWKGNRSAAITLAIRMWLDSGGPEAAGLG